MIVGSLVRLRAIEETDFKFMHSLLNDPEVNRWAISTDAVPVSLDDVKDLTQRASESETDHLFIIESIQSGSAVGLISTGKIDMKNRVAAMGGIIIDKEQREHGYASQARILMLKYLFHELGMERVESEVMVDNERIVRIVERSGFVYEGRCRSKLFKCGKRWDTVSFSMLRSEFDKHYGGAGQWSEEEDGADANKA